MTAFDYVAITILLASVVVGVFRGLVKEVLSLVAWVAAFVVANQYGAAMAGLLPAVVPAGTLRLVIGFGLLFVGTLLLAALLNRAIAPIISAAGLKGTDRGLGALFGAARGLLIAMTVVVLAGLTDLPTQPVWRDALLSELIESAVRTVKPLLPDDWARHVNF